MSTKQSCTGCGHEPDEHDGFPDGSSCIWANDAHQPCPGTYVQVEINDEPPDEPFGGGDYRWRS